MAASMTVPFLTWLCYQNCVEVSGNAAGHLAAAVGQSAFVTVLQKLDTALSRPQYGARSTYDWKKRK